MPRGGYRKRDWGHVSYMGCSIGRHMRIRIGEKHPIARDKCSSSRCEVQSSRRVCVALYAQRLSYPEVGSEEEIDGDDVRGRTICG